MTRFYLWFAAAVGLLCAACESTPRWPHADSGWKTYHNESVGYSLDYPAVCSVHEYDDGGVIFRFDGGPILCVSYLTERAADKRGLWADHDPVAEAALDGRSGSRYRYDHYDGPMYMHVTSYVVAHNGRYLGLAFRTAHEDLNVAQTRVLESFRFSQAGGGR